MVIQAGEEIQADHSQHAVPEAGSFLTPSGTMLSFCLECLLLFPPDRLTSIHFSSFYFRINTSVTLPIPLFKHSPEYTEAIHSLVYFLKYFTLSLRVPLYFQRKETTAHSEERNNEQYY